ncbi:MAG TPA: AAA family ATPase [Solirubrobacterales bacterium]|nr:AAA family ATPase [Solirubrobacterales bacterium]
MPPATDPPVLILTGPPGAGKTTTAGILAARSDSAVHLEADLFFSFIRSGYVEPWRPESHEQNGLVMRIVGEAAAAYAAAGYFTIVDGIVIPRWYLGPLREVFAAADLAVAYAVLRPSLSTCISRIDDREGGPLAEPAVIEQLWDEFAALGEFERNAIEVDDERPEEAADAISRLLGDGKLTL